MRVAAVLVRREDVLRFPVAEEGKITARGGNMLRWKTKWDSCAREPSYEKERGRPKKVKMRGPTKRSNICFHEARED